MLNSVKNILYFSANLIYNYTIMKTELGRTAKEHLKGWRPRIKKSGFTQEQIAAVANLAPSTLSLYISGKLNPRLDKFWEVETFLCSRGV